MSYSDQEEALSRFQGGLFVGATFASAFLIFLVQPLVAKQILPWFGGSAGVWMVCLAFYQSALFCGYAYAHALIRFAKPTVQVGVHGLVLALAIASLPVLPDTNWKPLHSHTPTLQITWLLMANVALPFAALAATGPLVQAWFSRRYPARSPYPLYAVSNVGSLLALFAFPFLFEPNLSLQATGASWAAAFVATALAILACAFIARQGVAGRPAPMKSAAPLSPRRTALWILLPATAVILLMGVTNEITLDIASIPFLWILPLASYLVTFILCFASEKWYVRDLYLVVTGLCTALLLQTLWVPGLPLEILFYCGLLFGTCMLMHGELYRQRPPAESLTLFYLCVAGGGALGGLFAGIVAPQIFSDYYEMPLGFALAWVLVLFTWQPLATSWLDRLPRIARHLIAVATTVTVPTFFVLASDTRLGDSLHRERTFFGVLRVREAGKDHNVQRQMTSGNTLHGMQFMHESMRTQPTTYYGIATPIGIVFRAREEAEDTRIGVVGLGIGSLASYGRKGDSFRFYELDPAVIRIAQNPEFFDLLAQSQAEVTIVEGDGRLSLEAEGEDREPLDVLVIDAFSSDAIPVHLLTKEAFEIYRKRLADDGVIAIHVSNRYFDLVPLISRIARELSLSGASVTTWKQPRRQSTQSLWVFLSPDPERIAAISEDMEADRVASKLPVAAVRIQDFAVQAEDDDSPPWTDNWSNLMEALRR